jgi:hypothetical protein
MHPLFFLALPGTFTVETRNDCNNPMELTISGNIDGAGIIWNTSIFIRAHNNDSIQFTVYVSPQGGVNWPADGTLNYDRDSGSGYSNEASHGVTTAMTAVDSYTFTNVRRGQKFRVTFT